MELASGQMVSGQYEIREQLGRGGFGVVYKAFDSKLAREVAIKLLLHDQDIDGTFGQRFRREIRLVRQLEHPNIVRLYDFGELAGSPYVPYMVMEFVRGEEVAEQLMRNGPMSLRLAQSVMLQVLDGLVSAHQLNIIHRDLKPNNIMLTKVGMRSDFVKILDFGIAKAVHEAERDSKTTFETQNQLVGTPAYMAPEQLRQETIGPFTDVYAAGLIFIELLTGKALLEGSMVEVVAKHIDSRPHELPARARGGPFAGLITRAVAKNKDERFANAREMYKALAAIQLEGPVVGIDTGPVPRVGGGGSGPATPRPSDSLLVATEPVVGQPMVAELPPTAYATTPTGEELKHAKASVRGATTEKVSKRIPWLTITLIVLALAVAVGGGILLTLVALGSGADADKTGAQAAETPDMPEGVPSASTAEPKAAQTQTPVAPQEDAAAAAANLVTTGTLPEPPPGTPEGSPIAPALPEVNKPVVEASQATHDEPATEVSEPPTTQQPATPSRSRRRARAAATVTITFVTTPPGATVRVAGKRCTTPCSLPVEKSKHVSVQATKGHDSVKETIDATRDATVELRLFRGL